MPSGASVISGMYSPPVSMVSVVDAYYLAGIVAVDHIIARRRNHGHGDAGSLRHGGRADGELGTSAVAIGYSCCLQRHVERSLRCFGGQGSGDESTHVGGAGAHTEFSPRTGEGHICKVDIVLDIGLVASVAEIGEGRDAVAAEHVVA